MRRIFTMIFEEKYLRYIQKVEYMENTQGQYTDYENNRTPFADSFMNNFSDIMNFDHGIMQILSKAVVF